VLGKLQLEEGLKDEVHRIEIAIKLLEQREGQRRFPLRHDGGKEERKTGNRVSLRRLCDL